MRFEIRKLIKFIWNTEELPKNWQELLTFQESYDLHLQGSALRNVGNHLPDDTASKLLGTQFQ